MHEEKYITHIHKGIASHRAANSRPERRYMNDLRGMTVWEFKDILEDMKKECDCHNEPFEYEFN